MIQLSDIIRCKKERKTFEGNDISCKLWGHPYTFVVKKLKAVTCTINMITIVIYGSGDR
jgi:hypothetical protein